EKKSFAAKAVLKQIDAVIRNWHNSVASDYECSNTTLALAIAIEFDLDRDWADRIMQRILHRVAWGDLHQVFLLARQRGIWNTTIAVAKLPALDEIMAIRAESMKKSKRKR